MSVSFRNFPSTDDCYICQDTMKLSDSIAHVDGGEFHPLHRECLKVWLQYNDKCPMCRIQVDVNSMFTWKDKVFRQLKLIRKDAIIWGIMGAIMITTSLMLSAIIHRIQLEAKIDLSLAKKGMVYL